MNTVSPGLEQIGTIAPDQTGKGNIFRWSVGCETLDRDYADFSQYKDYVGKLGVGYARIQSGWAKCEKKKGVYDFGWLDGIVDGLAGEGVKPWMCLCYGNPLYQSGKGLGSSIFEDKATTEAWCKYVKATVKRYKGRVAMWEIWNEPNLGENGKKPETYANLLIATAETIRSIDPDAVIIGFGLSRIPLKYTESVLDILKKEGKLNLLNYISFHPYYENPDIADSSITALRELVGSYNPDIKLMQGECGCPSILEWGHALRYHEWTEYSQAKWDLRRMACDFTLDIPSSIFTIVDLQYPNMQQSFGLLRTNLLKQVVYERPSYHGVMNMASILGAKYHSAGALEYESGSARKIKVTGIADSAGKIRGALIWFGDKVPGRELAWSATCMKIKGTDIKNPVYIEPITGRVYKPELTKGCISGNGIYFQDLPVWDSPVIIMESSEVKLSERTPDSGEQEKGSVKDMMY
jgi:hypothetical protein